MLRYFVVLGVFLSMFFVMGCKSQPKAAERAQGPSAKITTDFERGLKSMEKEQYGEAIKIFDRILVQNPATELDLVVLYNSAAAYEGLAQCQEANDRYRRVVRSSAGKFQQLEGQALFRIALTYECLNQDTKTVAALIDTLRRAKGLAPEIVKAEVPARLSAAYARLGNRAKALEYFGIASRGLKKLVVTTRGTQLELMSRTMFLMGQLSDTQKTATMDPLVYAQSIFVQQPYLLQAAETGHPRWAKRAADELVDAYDNIWKIPVTDENRSEFYIRTMQNIHELKKLKLVNESDLVEGVYQKIAKVEGRLQSELAKTSESTRLTQEAERREGLKRDGKVVSPATVLEKKKKVDKR